MESFLPVTAPTPEAWPALERRCENKQVYNVTCLRLDFPDEAKRNKQALSLPPPRHTYQLGARDPPLSSAGLGDVAVPSFPSKNWAQKP